MTNYLIFSSYVLIRFFKIVILKTRKKHLLNNMKINIMNMINAHVTSSFFLYPCRWLEEINEIMI